MSYEARFSTRKINDKIKNEKSAQNEKRIPWKLKAGATLKLKVSTPRERWPTGPHTGTQSYPRNQSDYEPLNLQEGIFWKQ